MEETIASAVAAQRGEWDAVSELMMQHVAQKEVDLSALRQQAAALTAQLTAFAAGAASALDSTAAAAGSGLQARLSRAGKMHVSCIQFSPRFIHVTLWERAEYCI